MGEWSCALIVCLVDTEDSYLILGSIEMYCCNIFSHLLGSGSGRKIDIAIFSKKVDKINDK
jgi:hypothetical protein